jgi:predicted site-specific integrase-resolvase
MDTQKREGYAGAGEVAAYLGINPATLARWGREGKGPRFTRTEGGHRSYAWTDVRAYANHDVGAYMNRDSLQGWK